MARLKFDYLNSLNIVIRLKYEIESKLFSPLSPEIAGLYKLTTRA